MINFKLFSSKFWMLNGLQMLEKVAYWTMLLQMPIYIAQKDVPGGLHWDQTIKGVIFFWWAFVQNFSPILFGFLADRFNDKKVFNLSITIIMISYVLVGMSNSLSTMIFSCILLGIGSAIFKPTVQGAIAKELSEENQSRGWGIYFMLINLAVFLAPPISKYLKEINWIYIFWGSAAITFLNLILNIFINKTKNLEDTEKKEKTSFHQNFFLTFDTLFKPKLIIFIISMAGFAIIYMQFYETMPNFFYDWTNTTYIAKFLPDFMLMNTNLGKMISYEWLYNINSLLVLLLVVRVSIISSKINIVKALMIGVTFAFSGLLLSGYSTNGWFAILGIIVYTLGEMITNPKFTQYLAEQSGENNKSMYLSYLNISFGLGLTFGAIFGSWLYESFAEKAELASKYLLNELHFSNFTDENAFNVFKTQMSLNDYDAVNLLFNHYHPNLIWLVFVTIGILSLIGLYYVLVYRNKD